MTIRKPQILLLSLAVSLALAACDRGDKPAATGTADAPADAAPALTLDESTLPPVNRFILADLDSSKNACADFGGYVNGKWLAANAIPSDRTSWGAFEMLDERSTAVQRQLAEQAAADETATGVTDIVGDFWPPAWTRHGQCEKHHPDQAPWSDRAGHKEAVPRPAQRGQGGTPGRFGRIRTQGLATPSPTLPGRMG